MGLNWSDILYPDNPNRRDEVNKLAQSIRTSVAQIFGNVRTMSIALHRACNKFQEVDPLDHNLTYEANFQTLRYNVLAQWKRTTEEMKLDPNISQKIKDLMSKFEEAKSVGRFPDTVNDIVSHPSIVGNVSEAVVGIIVGSLATSFVNMCLVPIIASTALVLTAAGLSGIVVGVVAGVAVGIIIGAIEGAQEREELEKLKREYKAMDQNLRDSLGPLEDATSTVVWAITKATN